MDYPGTEKFIKDHIRYKQHWKRKHIGVQDAKWQPLANDTWIEGQEFAKGSQFKVFETQNFGYVVFHPESKTPTGNVPHRRIFKF